MKASIHTKKGRLPMPAVLTQLLKEFKRDPNAIAEHLSKAFPITSVCRDDLWHAFAGTSDEMQGGKRMLMMTDNEMTQLARYMAEDYCSQLFHDSLRIIFRERFMKVRR